MNYEEYLRLSEEYYNKYGTYNRIKRSLLRPYFRFFHRLEVTGLENIPDGPAIIAANHTGGFDLDLTALSYFAHPRREITPLITESWHFINSLWGKLCVGCGLPLPTKGGLPYDLLDPYLMKGGGRYPGLICIFPEGNIKSIYQQYTLGKFFPGPVRMALRYRVPVIPAALIGFQSACPVFKIIPHNHAPDDVICLPFTLPFKTRIEFGKPVDLSEYYGRNLNKAQEYWIANNVLQPALADVLGKHAAVKLDDVDAPMRDP